MATSAHRTEVEVVIPVHSKSRCAASTRSTATPSSHKAGFKDERATQRSMSPYVGTSRSPSPFICSRSVTPTRIYVPQDGDYMDPVYEARLSRPPSPVPPPRRSRSPVTTTTTTTTTIAAAAFASSGCSTRVNGSPPSPTLSSRQPTPPSLPSRHTHQEDIKPTRTFIEIIQAEDASKSHSEPTKITAPCPPHPPTPPALPGRDSDHSKVEHLPPCSTSRESQLQSETASIAHTLQLFVTHTETVSSAPAPAPAPLQPLSSSASAPKSPLPVVQSTCEENDSKEVRSTTSATGAAASAEAGVTAAPAASPRSQMPIEEICNDNMPSTHARSTAIPPSLPAHPPTPPSNTRPSKVASVAAAKPKSRSSAPYTPVHLEDSDSEDELTLKWRPPVQSSASQPRLSSATRIPRPSSTHAPAKTQGKDVIPSTRRSAAQPKVPPPKFELPGQRTTSRKRKLMDDLMSRKGADIAMSLDFDTTPQHASSRPSAVIAKSVSPPSSVEVTPTKRKAPAEDPQTVQPGVVRRPPGGAELDESAQREVEMPASPDIRAHAAQDTTYLPSPVPSPSAHSDALHEERDEVVTPSKRTKLDVTITPSRHLTPTKALKKRTPTKAVKTNNEAPILTTELIIPASVQQHPALPPTPEATPDRSSMVSAAPCQRDFPRSSVVHLLKRVLLQLSSVTASIVPMPRPEQNLPAYRGWLASQLCMSPGHAVAEKDVRATLDRTIREGEGNCLMLIGERGVGKSAIVQRSTKLLESVYGPDGFLVVNLSGLVQRDDKAALKEIARQMCSSAYIDDEDTAENGTSFTSNAMILSSLLAILEPGASDDPEEAANKSKPLIFVIDEFDLFAHYSRQSFLYCLLDCVQGGSRRAGMAVLGLSARADCIETLEKRVKSRCQSRVHHILPTEDVFEGTAAMTRQALQITQDLNRLHLDADLVKVWNHNIQTLFSDKTLQMQLTAMNELRGLDGDRKTIDVMFRIVANLLQTVQSSSGSGISSEALMLRSSSLTPFIQLPERLIPKSLSIVELAMLIAAKHLVEEAKPLNFVIAYERYSDHCKRAAASGSSSTRAFNRGMCLRAFDRLKQLGVLKDASNTAKSIQLGAGSIFKLYRLVPWPAMIEEAVKERKDVPQHLAKWCKVWSD